MDGDVEEDVDFVRFMIGWQKSEAAEFLPLQKIVPDSQTDKNNKQSNTFLPWDCLVVPSTPTRKIKSSTLPHDLGCLTVYSTCSIVHVETMINYYNRNIHDMYPLSDAGRGGNVERKVGIFFKLFY